MTYTTAKEYFSFVVDMSCERIQVECYSGHKVNERPVAFVYRGTRWEIEEIVDRWYEGGIKSGHPETNCFKVRTVGGGVFMIRYLSLFDAWSIQV